MEQSYSEKVGYKRLSEVIMAIKTWDKKDIKELYKLFNIIEDMVQGEVEPEVDIIDDVSEDVTKDVIEHLYNGLFTWLPSEPFPSDLLLNNIVLAVDRKGYCIASFGAFESSILKLSDVIEHFKYKND